ncbi:BatD family protein [Marinagarivorans algicola]|uniref:BatD family protein n=1 Tax=Marinagarivorans algicola TaxID=1513270 RepID=UPI0006B98451|nr:BatD family protein [Marinagarivorans algicola]
MASKTMKTTLQVCLAVVFSIAWLHTAQAAERLSVQADRSTIAENETLTLTVKYQNGRSKSAPDFSRLKDNFDILGNNQSSQYINTNGQVTSVVQWTLTLAPKQAGKILIPPLSLGQAQSQPINISVHKAKALPKGSQVVFLETHVSTDQAYVQEEFIVVLKLFFRENIVDFDAEPFTIKGASFEELPRAQYQKNIGHATYNVLEMRFAVTANASGTLDAPSFLWNLRSSSAPANRFGMSSGRTTLHRLRTDPFTITVKPRPDSYPASKPWLPAKMLTLSEKWSEQAPQFTVGEPVTRTITLTARGLTGEQLPPIADAINSDDFKFYPDQPKITSDTDDQGKLGARSESMAVIPTRAGTLTLPAVEISWWDTQSDSLQVATLPAKTITVKAATAKPEQSLSAVLPTTEIPTMAQTADNTQPQVIYQTSAGYWPWLCAALIILNIVQALVWILWFKKRPHAEQQAANNIPSQPSLTPAITAANNNDAKGCHHALNQWLYRHTQTAGTYNAQPCNIQPCNVQQYFAKTNADSALLSELKQLDGALFKPANSPWVGKALANALTQYSQKAATNTKEQPLAALYPA